MCSAIVTAPVSSQRGGEDAEQDGDDGRDKSEPVASIGKKLEGSRRENKSDFPMQRFFKICDGAVAQFGVERVGEARSGRENFKKVYAKRELAPEES